MTPLLNGALVTFLKSGAPEEHWLLETADGKSTVICEGEVGIVLSFDKIEPTHYEILVNDRVIIDVNEFMIQPLRQSSSSGL
jgi:hypothetical protein